ncbi:putative leucine-rich repeat domain superfamily, transport inhibitor response 1 [Helianthus annuus]|nr:putative leucine-rich repeat domain superfamily, transport inhibitor response 1 [Helianthus annuus]KAJ0579111.1 putative leucine-rich repeat domain superfamily, transport inhibitor response 1 [Helianthus annuus]KAJ0586233.1 putative leucine-rich repeat domain superfamily, transport inhibitor response 1 [Helianthus annuus]KAJ0748718.1 putative leucine-rich repeat domain superfamily, transport inhibitor response 1 [Helianthus annuus]KAJ0920935.1 putative leucine-rich repeat domain superfamily,
MNNNQMCESDGKSRTGSGTGEYFITYPDQVLENVLENVLLFLKSRYDRNAVSLVCKSWYRAEAYTRSDLFIGNCYSVAPRRVTQRFTRVRSVTIKGKPRFADFSLLPQDWGAHFTPWVLTMASAYRALEKIHLKRMSVTDDDLAVVAHSFPNFKELVLVCCDGFGTSGLAVVVSECRCLRVLELIEDEVTDDEVDWISCFPGDGVTNLESLAFDCVESAINLESLEKLVARSPMLKKLRLNRHVSISQLYRLLIRAPRLTHLGTGSFSPSEEQPQNDNSRESDYLSAFAACRSIVCLSGFREIAPEYLPAIVPICANLTSLNLSYANIDAEQLKPVIRLCHKLQVFWVLDSICDEGLQAVAETCKDLRELRVFPIDASENTEGPVSEVGLLAIALGCRKLQSILYFCQQMTNAAVVAMSKNCPDLVVFRLCIIGRYRPDRVTGEPMDEGFGAIVKNCKKLTRLAVSGLLTDKAFCYIGQYGKLVRTLSVAFAGDSDMGLKYVLEGCTNLQKLEIRDSPFGDSALLSGLHHFYNMRFVWMSSCRVTREGCLNVARHLPRLVVEVFRRDEEEGGERGDFVDTLYMYRSLDGPRADAPRFVKIL